MILVVSFVVIVHLGLAAESDQPGNGSPRALKHSGRNLSELASNSPASSPTSIGFENVQPADDNQELLKQYIGLVDYIEASYTKILKDLHIDPVPKTIQDLFRICCREWDSEGQLQARETLIPSFFESFDEFLDTLSEPSSELHRTSSEIEPSKTNWKVVMENVNHVLDAVKRHPELSSFLEAQPDPCRFDENIFQQAMDCFKTLENTIDSIMPILYANIEDAQIRQILATFEQAEAAHHQSFADIRSHFERCIQALEELRERAPSLRLNEGRLPSEETLHDAQRRFAEISKLVDAALQEEHEEKERRESGDHSAADAPIIVEAITVIAGPSVSAEEGQDLEGTERQESDDNPAADEPVIVEVNTVVVAPSAFGSPEPEQEEKERPMSDANPSANEPIIVESSTVLAAPSESSDVVQQQEGTARGQPDDNHAADEAVIIEATTVVVGPSVSESTEEGAKIKTQ